MDVLTLMLILVVVLTLGFLAAIAIAAWVATAALGSMSKLTALVEDLSKLLASGDPMTYQAIRAADSFASYDGASQQASTEEIEDGEDHAGWRDGEPLSDDPLVNGERLAGQVN